MSTFLSHLSQWNWIDVVAVVCLVRFGYIGASQGLGSALTRLVSVLAGVMVSFRGYQTVGDWVATRTFLSHEWAAAAVLVLGVLVTYALVGLALRLLQQAVTLRFAPSLDTVGGLALGLARAALVLSVGLVTLQQLPSDAVRASIDERSWSGRYLARVAPAVYDTVDPWVVRVLPSSVGPRPTP